MNALPIVQPLKHKTHSTGSGDDGVVVYGWHPWAGRAVRLHEVIGRAAGTAVRCTPVDVSPARLQEIPLDARPRRVRGNAGGAAVLADRARHQLGARPSRDAGVHDPAIGSIGVRQRPISPGAFLSEAIRGLILIAALQSAANNKLTNANWRWRAVVERQHR
ncbi:hypothetical protein MKK75_30630 [Methylobacterium sp. J-030]|uniref:hypothetical protein n=1 Tax=Methylobacterium sp. J-030 TaxID=2836627 RepID=UPI001FB8AF1A|nr:hypothetical protein [Methylobacterium sp. J-030]MCJ2073093.1 hypothetical protein [Methylobacterium sp. J-030]